MNALSYALVGCGVVARKHLKAARYHRKKIMIRAVVDSRPEAAEKLLRSFGLWPARQHGISLFADMADMLEKISPDLTAITTPSGSHYSLAAAALQAGSHVLVEKPLTLDLSEADQLLRLAAEKKRQIAVGHIYRFFPAIQILQADIESGRFGRVLYGDIKVRWGHDQAYYDQAAWRGTWQSDGGALMNQSIHALDLMTWLLGGRVVETSGWIDRRLHNLEAEDFGLAMLRFCEGHFCQLEGTTVTDPGRQEASFFIRCSEGEIRGGILAGKPSLQIRDRQGHKLAGKYLRRFIREIWKKEGLSALAQLKNPHTALYGDWIRAAISGQPPLADGLSGRRAVEHVLAIYQSARENRPVKLPVEDFAITDMQDTLR